MVLTGCHTRHKGGSTHGTASPMRIDGVSFFCHAHPDKRRKSRTGVIEGGKRSSWCAKKPKPKQRSRLVCPFFCYSILSPGSSWAHHSGGGSKAGAKRKGNSMGVLDKAGQIIQRGKVASSHDGGDHLGRPASRLCEDDTISSGFLCLASIGTGIYYQPVSSSASLP